MREFLWIIHVILSVRAKILQTLREVAMACSEPGFVNVKPPAAAKLTQLQAQQEALQAQQDDQAAPSDSQGAGECQSCAAFVARGAKCDKYKPPNPAGPGQNPFGGGAASAAPAAPADPKPPAAKKPWDWKYDDSPEQMRAQDDDNAFLSRTLFQGLIFLLRVLCILCVRGRMKPCTRTCADNLAYKYRKLAKSQPGCSHQVQSRNFVSSQLDPMLEKAVTKSLYHLTKVIESRTFAFPALMVCFSNTD